MTADQILQLSLTAGCVVCLLVQVLMTMFMLKIYTEWVKETKYRDTKPAAPAPDWLSHERQPPGKGLPLTGGS